MEKLTELWQALESQEGVTRLQKLGKRAIAFHFGGTQHSVYCNPDGESMVLFCLGNKVGVFRSVADVKENLTPIPV